ncbi:MAG: fibronectin type III domain-containing protein, partial [Actinomycetota bacterium]
ILLGCFLALAFTWPVTPAAAEEPPGPVVDAAGYFVSQVSGPAQVEWFAPTTGGEVTGYEVIGPDGPIPADQIQMSEPELIEVRIDADLTAAVTEVSVRAVGPGGDGPISVVELVGLRPGAPEDLTATVIDDDTVELSWSPPAHLGTGTIRGYSVWSDDVRLLASTSVDDRRVRLSAPPGAERTVRVVLDSSFGAGAAAAISFTIPRGAGYWMVEQDGAVYEFGSAQEIRSVAETDVVSVATDRTGTGLWLLRADGAVVTRDGAEHFGDADLAILDPEEAVTSIAVRPAGDGYWVFTDRGRVQAFGAAASFGDMTDVVLNGSIVASTSTASGGGYWMVGSDGGIFSFGDAEFHGSTGGLTLNEPVVGIAPDPDGVGYWLVAADGGIFAFEAEFRGSVPGALAEGTVLNAPVIGALAFGDGYLMVASDGGIFNFSGEEFFGSLGGQALLSPVIGVAAFS